MSVNNAISFTSERNNYLSSKQSSVSFERGVVKHVINNQEDALKFESIYPAIFDTYRANRVPRNACIVRRTSAGADVVNSSVTLAYPFFSSHLCLPLKEGETVWLFFDRDIKTTGYWLSRIHGDETSEDLNFSHFDRSYTGERNNELTPGTIERAEGEKKVANKNDFPNLSLRESNDVDEFDKIVRTAKKITPNEPVPRYTKRPGDFVLQGSNNTIIAMGSDRFWKKEDELESRPSNATAQANEKSGAIDVVVGRGRFSSKRTFANVFKNSRGYEEVVKDNTKGEKNTTEGDPDFHHDSSRIYISMNTKIDEALSLRDYIPILPNDISIKLLSEGPSVAIKTDHVRIVARKDEENNINGTIKIIKEGTIADDGDGCSISLHDDGIIHIAGPKIYLGLATENGGDASRDNETLGDSQPYIKYQELKTLVELILSNLSDFCEMLLTHVTPGYGSPSPQINLAAKKLSEEIEKRKEEIPMIRSNRIFGE